jgi:hypothetical protein
MSTELEVFSLVHHAHSPYTEFSEDPIMPKDLAVGGLAQRIHVRPAWERRQRTKMGPGLIFWLFFGVLSLLPARAFTTLLWPGEFSTQRAFFVSDAKRENAAWNTGSSSTSLHPLGCRRL